MNDVMPVLTLGCNLFLMVAASIALLSFSKACAAYVKRSHTAAFLSTATATSDSSTPVLMKLEEPPPMPEPEEEIECGACHQVIKSEPIQQILGSTTMPPSEIYKCETCGAQVQVPV
jgi:hypothetical protein